MKIYNAKQSGDAVDFVPPELAGMLGGDARRFLDAPIDPPAAAVQKEKDLAAQAAAAPKMPDALGDAFCPPELAGMCGDMGGGLAAVPAAPKSEPALGDAFCPPELAGICGAGGAMAAMPPMDGGADAGGFIPPELAGMFAQKTPSSREQAPKPQVIVNGIDLAAVKMPELEDLEQFALSAENISPNLIQTGAQTQIT